MSGLRWIIAGGGTGGHVTPALALGEAAAAAGDAVLFVGGSRGLEGRLVPEAGFELVRLPAGQVMGRGALGRVRGLVELAHGALRARRVLRDFAPDVVVSVGGYAAVPAMAAATWARTPLALVEPNAVPGRTNRLFDRFAARVFLGFEEATAAFPRAAAAGAVRISGVPLRRALVEGFAAAATHAPQAGRVRLLVFGGSQGARQINDALLEALGMIDPARLTIAHQTGEADCERVAAAYEAAGIEADVFAFDPDMPSRYREADLALCRSGAITVAELALAGLPALLVPYPYAADDHQTANARGMERAGAARLLDPRRLDGKVLADALVALLDEPEALNRMGGAARALARPDAAARVIEECRTLVSGPERNDESDPGRHPGGADPARAAAASTARAAGSAAPGPDRES